MKKKIILLFLCCLLIWTAQGQTLAQAKALYEQGAYEQAKPIFKKYALSNPGNGNYQLWYGVCCLNTQDTQEAVKRLEMAVKRRVPSGQLYLGQAYHQAYQFEDAIDTYETYIQDLIRRKRPTDEAEVLLAKSKIGLRQLKGVEQVCVIDSFVVNKQALLSAYHLSPESGKLTSYDDYFQTDKHTQGTVYETELGNKVYYAEPQADKTYSILSRTKTMNEWGQPTLLPQAINDSVNANYPYVMPDGVTIYFAADGEKSIGGYDLFVTRYNTENSTYLTPASVGMPFNSPYNDYLYIIDEYNNLGWFASDRYQPQDSVCVYVFVPNPTKEVYDYDTTDPQQLIQLAQLRSIQQTWKEEQVITAARKRLKDVTSQPTTTIRKTDFDFIIDDRHNYHQWTDFKSDAAKNAFQIYLQTEKAYQQRIAKLKELRAQYREHLNQKSSLTPTILDLEKRVEQLAVEVEKTAIEVRKLEKQTRK